MRQYGPWGQGFPEPVFEGEFEVIDQRIVGNNHLKLILELDDFNSVSAIMFNIDTNIWPKKECARISTTYKLDVNEYRGRHQVQLILEHIAVCHVLTEA